MKTKVIIFFKQLWKEDFYDNGKWKFIGKIMLIFIGIETVLLLAMCLIEILIYFKVGYKI